MPAQIVNLSHCPRCNAALGPSDPRCSTCAFAEIENVDFLDISDQTEYRVRLQSQREAWAEFEKSLQQELEKFGEEWSRSENWIEIWKRLESKAAAVGFNKRATSERARTVWSERELPETPKPPPHLEAVRNWVSNLTDGEVNVVLWEKFLQSLDGPVDDLFLEDFRDAEIKRQFAQFETARVDSLGNTQKGERKRVKRLAEKLGDDCELVMLRIPEGKFQMGSERYPWERPVHSVTVPGFYMAQYPVTQAQWRAVVRLPRVDVELGEDFSAFQGDNLPVDSVSWAEATEFCARVAKQTGRSYRLPTEAEWEYACRAGSRGEFAFGENITPVIVNYDGSRPYGAVGVGIFRKGTIPVGSLGAANYFGLYDMHGNVSEWCADEWHESYEGAPQDGLAWTSGNGVTHRVTRGGSWTNTGEICRSSDRSREASDLNTKLHYMGFRIAMSLSFGVAGGANGD